MFHLELRMGVHQARVFNLSADELNRRFLVPLTSGRQIRHEEEDWIPAKTRVTVFEAPQLRPDQIGMGRGWASVQKQGEDVTERMLAAAGQNRLADPAVEALKERLLGRLAGESVSLPEALSLAGEMGRGRRFSEQAAVAERAVWELLHTQELVLEADGQAMPETEWQWLVMDQRSWVDGAGGVRLTR